jgi:hypothetical protein
MGATDSVLAGQYRRRFERQAGTQRDAATTADATAREFDGSPALWLSQLLTVSRCASDRFAWRSVSRSDRPRLTSA